MHPLTASTLLDVATANVAELNATPGSMRAVVNAIFSLDAVVGGFHVEWKGGGSSTVPDDGKLRNIFASECPDYEIIRDAAFALKHGQLTGKKARLISRQDQIRSHPAAFDVATFDRLAFDTESVIWLETDAGDHPVYRIAERTLTFLFAQTPR